MMGRVIRLWPLAALAIALLVGAPAAARPVAEAGLVEAGVRAALAGYGAAAEAGDWDRMVDYYADEPGFVWIEDGAVRYRSRQDVAAAFAGLGSLFVALEMSFEEVRVVVLAEDVASVSLLFRQAMTTADGTRVEVEGAILVTMVEREGVWRFLAGHTSSRRARPAAAPEPAHD